MTDMGPAARLRRLHGGQTARLLSAARVIGLAALLWTVSSEHASDGAPTPPPGLLVLVAFGWVGWLAARRFGAPPYRTWIFMAVLAGAGGVTAGYAPIGIAFPAIAALAASVDFDPLPALGIGSVGAATLIATVLALDAPLPIIAEGLLSIAAGLLGGTSRRQYRDRAVQAEQLLAERVRADAERDRAAALAERNRIGREIHDVLAHSLGALAVQLDAADALLEQGSDTTRAGELVRRSRRLAVDGLAEARRAIQALRGEPTVLAEQLASLVALDGASLRVTGPSRGLDTDTGIALYRAAQEAISNARKHAPGAPVALQLDFGPDATVLVVTNGPCPGRAAAGDLGATGGGFGLRGMAERIAELGGTVVAEPRGAGWAVEVTVPA